MRSSGRRLLAGDAAADGHEFQSGVLRSFHSAAHGFADEGRYFDAALLHI
jgi:hypothetical protein